MFFLAVFWNCRRAHAGPVEAQAQDWGLFLGLGLDAAALGYLLLHATGVVR